MGRRWFRGSTSGIRSRAMGGRAMGGLPMGDPGGSRPGGSPTPEVRLTGSVTRGARRAIRATLIRDRPLASALASCGCFRSRVETTDAPHPYKQAAALAASSTMNAILVVGISTCAGAAWGVSSPTVPSGATVRRDPFSDISAARSPLPVNR